MIVQAGGSARGVKLSKSRYVLKIKSEDLLTEWIRDVKEEDQS